MDSSKLAFGLAAFGMVAGCSSVPTYTFPQRDGDCVDLDGNPCTGAMSEADRTHEVPETMPDATYTYVVATISIPKKTPDPDGDGPLRAQAAGFDVDGLDSGDGSTAVDATCQEAVPDFVSVTDPNHVGVDNAFEGLIGTIEGFLPESSCGMTRDGCLDRTLQQQISDGSLLLAMTVSGVNDFSYDSSVTLQLHLLETTDGMPPMVGGDGALVPGQSFTKTMDLGVPVEGDIFAGRLRARTDSLPLEINTGDFMLTLNITQAQVRFNISETGISNGAIGGVVTVDAIVAAASALMPGIEDTVRRVIESVSDVDPKPDDPGTCQALSLGILFSGVNATY